MPVSITAGLYSWTSNQKHRTQVNPDKKFRAREEVIIHRSLGQYSGLRSTAGSTMPFATPLQDPRKDLLAWAREALFHHEGLVSGDARSLEAGRADERGAAHAIPTCPASRTALGRRVRPRILRAFERQKSLCGAGSGLEVPMNRAVIRGQSSAAGRSPLVRPGPKVGTLATCPGHAGWTSRSWCRSE